MDAPDLLWSDRVRGLILGLTLGDALGTPGGGSLEQGQLRAGVSTQLAAFTLDGLVRARVRFSQRGICHPPSVVWHALCRWAFLHQVAPDRMAVRWARAGGAAWPDGWLVEVPAFAEHRGNAPATVATLRRLEPGTVDHPATSSAGCHALVRTLPAAAGLSRGTPADAAEFARELAAQTHGASEAQEAAAAGAHLAVSVIGGTPMNDAVDSALEVLSTPSAMIIDHAQHAALKLPGQLALLAEITPNATAMSALAGGLYASLSFPGRADIHSALNFAVQAPDADSVAAVTGAFLGAVHGVDALPVGAVSRLEVAWAMDTLARDLILERLASPVGDPWSDSDDSEFLTRYPGW